MLCRAQLQGARAVAERRGLCNTGPCSGRGEGPLTALRPSPALSGSGEPCRILIYSHDTFGLGHLRRSRTIANAVAGALGARVVVVSGSPVADRFAFAPGVSAVPIPAVTKRVDGGYASLEPGRALAETIAARTALIARTAERFRPHLVVVDKEPTGFHGEILEVLERARREGARLVLGLRDVLDDPARLAPEWARKGAGEALARLYHEVWVYGVARIHRPLDGLDLDAGVADRLIYTGYLRRDLPPPSPGRTWPPLAEAPFLLVTPGGGGDGAALIDWVIAAYEADPGIPLPALVAFGPFLDVETRSAFLARIARLPGRLSAITFDSEIERLMHQAAGIVAMGGYNTFCEILSFDKRAVLVPRTEPRREQEIRARAAEALGLLRVLADGGDRNPGRMAAALRALPDQPEPSRVVVPGLLDGLDAIVGRVRALAEPALRRAGAP